MARDFSGDTEREERRGEESGEQGDKREGGREVDGFY